MLIIFLSKCAECLEILPAVIFVTPFCYDFRKRKAIDDALKKVADRQVLNSLLEGLKPLYHRIILIKPNVRGCLVLFFVLFVIQLYKIV